MASLAFLVATPDRAEAVTAIGENQSRLFTLPTPNVNPAAPPPATEKITVSDNAALDLGSAFTLEAWVKPNSSATDRTIAPGV